MIKKKKNERNTRSRHVPVTALLVGIGMALTGQFLSFLFLFFFSLTYRDCAFGVCVRVCRRVGRKNSTEHTAAWTSSRTLDSEDERRRTKRREEREGRK
jgi:hypothetical protein